MITKSYTVVEDEGELAFHTLHSEWDALWKESYDVTHFQCWNWQYLYWKHVIPQAVPKFALLRDGLGRCRAIVLMSQTRDPKTGMMTTGFVGGMRSDHNMFLVGNDVPVQAGVDLLRKVIYRNRRNTHALTLRNIPSASWTARVIKEYCANIDGDSVFELSEGETHTVSLPSTLDKYLASLSKRSRRHFGYDRRRLMRECRTEFLVHEGSCQVEAIIDRIEAIDVTRWGSESMYCRPQRRAFERSIIKALADDGLLLVFLLYVDGKPASFAWCSTVRGVVEVARIAYDPSFPSKLSIGAVANFYAIEECIKRGYFEFNLGRGGEAYKAWLGARVGKLVNFYVYRSKFDLMTQKWAAKLGGVVRKQGWLRNAYRKYVSG